METEVGGGSRAGEGGAGVSVKWGQSFHLAR